MSPTPGNSTLGALVSFQAFPKLLPRAPPSDSQRRSGPCSGRSRDARGRCRSLPCGGQRGLSLRDLSGDNRGRILLEVPSLGLCKARRSLDTALEFAADTAGPLGLTLLSSDDEIGIVSNVDDEMEKMMVKAQEALRLVLLTSFDEVEACSDKDDEELENMKLKAREALGLALLTRLDEDDMVEEMKKKAQEALGLALFAHVDEVEEDEVEDMKAKAREALGLALLTRLDEDDMVEEMKEKAQEALGLALSTHVDEVEEDEVEDMKAKAREALEMALAAPSDGKTENIKMLKARAVQSLLKALSNESLEEAFGEVILARGE